MAAGRCICASTISPLSVSEHLVVERGDGCVETMPDCAVRAEDVVDTESSPNSSLTESVGEGGRGIREALRGRGSGERASWLSLRRARCGAVWSAGGHTSTSPLSVAEKRVLDRGDGCVEVTPDLAVRVEDAVDTESEPNSSLMESVGDGGREMREALRGRGSGERASGLLLRRARAPRSCSFSSRRAIS